MIHDPFRIVRVNLVVVVWDKDKDTYGTLSVKWTPNDGPHMRIVLYCMIHDAMQVIHDAHVMSQLHTHYRRTSLCILDGLSGICRTLICYIHHDHISLLLTIP